MEMGIILGMVCHGGRSQYCKILCDWEMIVNKPCCLGDDDDYLR